MGLRRAISHVVAALLPRADAPTHGGSTVLLALCFPSTAVLTVASTSVPIKLYPDHESPAYLWY